MNEGPSHRRVNRENDSRAGLHPALSQPVGSSVGHSTVLSPPTSFRLTSFHFVSRTEEVNDGGMK